MEDKPKQLTKAEITIKSTNKINQILNLAALLQVEISAKQRINSEGFIENNVYLYDIEKYDIKEESEDVIEVLKDAVPTPPELNKTPDVQ